MALTQPIPASIFENPDIASKNIHAVNTNGPVSAGNPHIPKNRCRAGITKQQDIVAKTAIRNDPAVKGMKLVNAIITKT